MVDSINYYKWHSSTWVPITSKEGWSQEDSVYCEFGLLLLLGRIASEDWHDLVKCLNFVIYISPEERILNKTLLDVVFSLRITRIKQIHKFIFILSDIESHFTEAHQQRMLSLLMSREKESKQLGSKTEKSPDFVV